MSSRAGRPARSARGARDQGSGSVVMLALGTVLMLATVGVGSAGQVVAARHRAESAADLSALAAASTALLGGSGAACERAAQVAAAHRAQLVECTVDPDLTTRVVVVEELPEPLAVLGPVLGRARAGPAG